jgi:hypothetical protein
VAVGAPIRGTSTTEVAVGAGDVEVAGLVGGAESPAHAKAIMSISEARTIIIGFVL